jgi:hypothetical protein
MEKNCGTCRFENSSTCFDIVGRCSYYEKWQPKEAIPKTDFVKPKISRICKTCKYFHRLADFYSALKYGLCELRCMNFVEYHSCADWQPKENDPFKRIFNIETSKLPDYKPCSTCAHDDHEGYEASDQCEGCDSPIGQEGAYNHGPWLNPDPVKHPNHYTWIEGVECNEIAGHFTFNAGSALKYIWRHQHKGSPVQDLRKAIQFLEFEVKRLSHESRVAQRPGHDQPAG